MSKKRVNRRPDEKLNGPGAGANAPDNAARDRMPDDFEQRKGFEKPAAGDPTDKPLPTPGAGVKRKDFFEGERSDRESGRPVQLEGDQDDERSDRQSGRPVRLGTEASPSEQPTGRQNRSQREAEPTKR